MNKINNYVLDRGHLESFIDCIIDSVSSEIPEIDILIDDCQYYTASVHSNNYFFSKNIQRKIIKGIYPAEYLNNVYQIEIERDFSLEELDSKFIHFLISHTSNMNIDLDTHLKEIQEDFVNSYYGKQIRY